MTKVLLRNGEEAKLVIDKSSQSVYVERENGLRNLICFMRDNKVVVKNDLLLSDNDLLHARTEMKAFIKQVQETKSKKRK